jgi:uncharacterized membrane protein
MEPTENAPLADVTPTAPTNEDDAPLAVRLLHVVERSAGLDDVGGVLRRLSAPLGSPRVGGLLRGRSTGHALHPFLTDLPIGCWSAAVLLDMRGRRSDRAAARFLMAAGLAFVTPTVATGLVEWRETTRPESRVGSLHAMLNAVAVALYATSLALRMRDRHRTGVTTSLVATGVVSVAGHLGGHLTAVRKTGTRHPAFGEDGVGPTISRPRTVAL